jgi:methanogenic corrinoid protein MtbC1
MGRRSWVVLKTMSVLRQVQKARPPISSGPSDLLECDGWDVDFYGTSMPLRDLIGAIQEREPRFIGLSAALVMHLGSLKRTITAIREAFGAKTPPIVVGGNAFRGDPDLCKRVGADMYAVDASTAVEMLRGLKE